MDATFLNNGFWTMHDLFAPMAIIYMQIYTDQYIYIYMYIVRFVLTDESNIYVYVYVYILFFY